MRIALYTLSVYFGLLSGSVIVKASADAQPIPVYSVSSGSGVVEQTESLLPVQGRDLPLSSAADGIGMTSAAPQASVVEAIPTPTAFQTGVFLLLALASGRIFRKLRLA